MDIRAFVQRDLLALEVGDGLQRAVLGDQDRLGFGRRWLVAHIDEGSAGGLCEDRRGLASRAEVDRADVECLEQLRPGRELRPLDRIALRLQLFLKESLCFQQNERAVLLEPDTDDLVVRMGCSGRTQRNAAREYEFRKVA